MTNRLGESKQLIVAILLGFAGAVGVTSQAATVNEMWTNFPAWSSMSRRHPTMRDDPGPDSFP